VKKIILITALAFFGCGTKSNATGSAPSSSAGSAQTAAATASTAKTVHVHAGSGFFVDEKILICIDVDEDLPSQQDADDAIELQKSRNIGKDQRFFPGGCADSFKDRNVLATCTRPLKNGRGTELSSYYEVEALNGDKRMDECKSKGGTWQAVGH